MSEVLEIELGKREKLVLPIMPFEKLTPNTSFLVPWQGMRTSEKERIYRSVGSRAYYYGKNNDIVLSVGREARGVRVWRVK